ncbi:hypothetical protein FRC01_005253, partial [Tulasnella sp. 417]
SLTGTLSRKGGPRFTGSCLINCPGPVSVSTRILTLSSSIPRGLNHLFNQGASDEKGGVEEGRFVLKEDVEHLQARIGQVGVEDKARITLLKRELRKAQKDSQKIAQRMKMWTQDYEGRVFHVRNQRFTQFLQGLKKRWGWDLDELPPVKASPRFISLLIFVQSAPDLDYKVWNRAEVVIKSILEEDARMPVRSTSRPWSLSIPRSLAF